MACNLFPLLTTSRHQYISIHTYLYCISKSLHNRSTMASNLFPACITSTHSRHMFCKTRITLKGKIQNFIFYQSSHLSFVNSIIFRRPCQSCHDHFISVKFSFWTQKTVEVRVDMIGGGFFRIFLSDKSPMQRCLKETGWTPSRVTNYNDPGSRNSITLYIS